MSERPITPGERLQLMAYLAAPLLCMALVFVFESGKSSGWVVMRLFIALTLLVCGLLCSKRAEGMADWLFVLRKLCVVALTCWAVLALTLPGSVGLITLVLSCVIWLATAVSLVNDML